MRSLVSIGMMQVSLGPLVDASHGIFLKLGPSCRCFLWDLSWIGLASWVHFCYNGYSFMLQSSWQSLFSFWCVYFFWINSRQAKIHPIGNSFMTHWGLSYNTRVPIPMVFIATTWQPEHNNENFLRNRPKTRAKHRIALKGELQNQWRTRYL